MNTNELPDDVTTTSPFATTGLPADDALGLAEWCDEVDAARAAALDGTEPDPLPAIGDYEAACADAARAAEAALAAVLECCR